MGAIGYGQDIYPSGSSTAKDSVFDNTGTDLDSTNAEDAIKEVDGKVEELSSKFIFNPSNWVLVVGKDTNKLSLYFQPQSGSSTEGSMRLQFTDNTATFSTRDSSGNWQVLKTW